jgi:dUTP pyrophosphatase
MKIVQLRKGAILPTLGTCGSVGFDLYIPTTIDIEKDVKYYDMQGLAMIPMGFALEIPPEHAGLVMPRSSLAKSNLTIPNAPGLIDPDYRGEVGVLVSQIVDNGPISLRLRDCVKQGDKIAQIVFCRCLIEPFEIATELSKTGRGSGGFGSTGR